MRKDEEGEKKTCDCSCFRYCLIDASTVNFMNTKQLNLIKTPLCDLTDQLNDPLFIYFLAVYISNCTSSCLYQTAFIPMMIVLCLKTELN